MLTFTEIILCWLEIYELPEPLSSVGMRLLWEEVERQRS